MSYLEKVAKNFGRAWRWFVNLYDMTFYGIDKTGYLLLAIILGIVLGVAGLAYHRYAHFETKEVCKKVAVVGGCSRGGTCGVGYEDGTRGMAYMPVPGQLSCQDVLVKKQ